MSANTFKNKVTNKVPAKNLKQDIYLILYQIIMYILDWI